MGAGMARAIPVRQHRLRLKIRAVLAGREPGCGPRGSRPVRSSAPARVRAVGPLRVEAGRRAAEGAAAAGQARRGAGAGGAVGRVRGVAAGRDGWGGAARQLAVVLVPVRRGAQRVVGLRDLHEFGARVRVVRVAVGVVLL